MALSKGTFSNVEITDLAKTKKHGRTQSELNHREEFPIINHTLVLIRQCDAENHALAIAAILSGLCHCDCA